MKEFISSFNVWDEEGKHDVWANTNPDVVDRITHIATQVSIALANRYDCDKPDFANMVVEDAWDIAEKMLIKREEWING
jgi:predicted glycosyl hydrolase (DUF1957 family)